MRKFLSSILAVIMALSLFVGCSTREAVSGNNIKSSEKVKITYWHFDNTASIMSALEKNIKKFTEKYPNIEVETLGLPEDSFYQKYVTAIATNTAPDVFGMRNGEAALLIQQGALLNLDSYFDSWESKDQIEAPAINAARAITADKKLYMIPSYMNMCTVWYNSKIFNEKGITVPKTIDEFLADCQNYADPKNNKYFYSLRGGSGSYDNLFIFLMSYAGANSFFDDQGNAVINQPVFVEALQKYTDIYKKGYTSRDSISNDYKEMVAEFGSGTSMYLLHNNSSVLEHKKNLGDGNFMNANPPAGPTGKIAIPQIGVIGASVSAKTKYKEQAVKLVEFLAEADAASSFCQATGKVPINKAVYNEQWAKDDPFMPLYLKNMSDPNIIYYSNPLWLSQWPDFNTRVMVPDFQEILMNEKTCKDVLDNWAKLLTQYQKAYLQT